MAKANEKNFNIGQCPICCEYGGLEICKEVDNNQYLVICDECLLKWKKPEDALKNINGHRGSINKGEVQSASLDEIKDIGWDKYLVDR